MMSEQLRSLAFWLVLAMVLLLIAQLRLLGFWSMLAIVLGLIAWRLWRQGPMRFSALEALLIKRTPEGCTFDAPYPPGFNRRRWTYLLTDAQKERLTEGLRLWMRTATLVVVGLIILGAIPLAIWRTKLPDLLRGLLAGSPGTWLLVCLVLVLLYGTLVSAVFVTRKRWFDPVLRDARQVGPAHSVSLTELTAETTSVRELRSQIIWEFLALLASVIAACVAAYLSPSPLYTELLLAMAVVFGLFAVWYVTVLVVKLRAGRSPLGGPWGSSGSR